MPRQFSAQPSMASVLRTDQFALGRIIGRIGLLVFALIVLAASARAATVGSASEIEIVLRQNPGVAERLADPEGPGIQAVLRVPGDYPTIQSAIDASELGDIVLVSPGTYVENLDMPRAASLVSRDATVVAAAAELPTLALHDTGLDPVNVAGMVFDAPGRKNDAVQISASRDVWLENVVASAGGEYFSALAVLEDSQIHALNVAAEGVGNDFTVIDSVVGLERFNRCE